MKFKEGDKVICINEECDSRLKGKEGSIYKIFAGEYLVVFKGINSAVWCQEWDLKLLNKEEDVKAKVERFDNKKDYNWCYGVDSSVLNDEKEEIKMWGIKAEVEIKVARIDKKANEVIVDTISADNIQWYVMKDRLAAIDGCIESNIIELKINGEVKFKNNLPWLEVKDSKQEYARLCGEKEELAVLKDAGVISDDNFRMEFGKANKLFKDTSDKVEYKLMWDEVKF